MTSEDASQLVASFEKNRREEVRIELAEYKDHDLINVRVEHLPALLAGLKDAEALAVRNGLLPEIQEAAQ